ncbi:glutathione peroxidase [Nocardioides anomalus]|uniref:Glutathione peroxidase n=1 Tax=Nocardioides anomalus TaxID=2712223 RepID=A0A6G6WIZ1_9ACTN|nr:glutathione peroxidase [Nocardioides anomalus]QIG45301.1 glutathione peroxidase [Nocardioides anomalus]
MSILEEKIARLDGTATTLGDITAGRPALLVNVASRCGLTPQYAGLERLQEAYGDEAFTVVGFPCNQFLGQEPGSAEEIQEFCSSTYGVTFPMTEKIEVNGEDRHPVYAALTRTPDEKGEAGDVAWNFEKFLLAADGSIVARFSPTVEPEDERILEAVRALASA